MAKKSKTLTNVKTFAKNGGMIGLNKPNMGLYGRS